MNLLPSTAAWNHFIYQHSFSRNHNLQSVSTSTSTNSNQATNNQPPTPTSTSNRNNNNMPQSHLPMKISSKADAAALYGMSLFDIADRFAVIQHKEMTTYRRVDYLLNCNYPSTTITMPSSLSLLSPMEQQEHRQSRSKMCSWCYQLTDICQLSRHAVVRSMSYLDRFMASSHPRAINSLLLTNINGDGDSDNNNKREYQLIAMTCLYIAIKLHEPLGMDASLMAEISQGCYAPEEILAMERDILSTMGLQWRVNDPTSVEIASSCLLALLEPHWYGYDLDVLGSLLDVSSFQCELAAMDYDLSVKCKASEVALAAVLNSLEGIMGIEIEINENARYEYLMKLCEVLGLGSSGDMGMNMSNVAYVQVELHRLFCRNNPGMDLHLSSSLQRKEEETMSSCCRSEEEDHDRNMNMMPSSDSSVIEDTTSMLSIDDEESEKIIANTESQCCSKVKQAKKCASSPVTVSVAVVTPSPRY